MKTICMYITIGLLSFCNYGMNAQANKKPLPDTPTDTVKNILKFNPLGAARYRGSTAVNYERYLAQHRSLTIGVSTLSTAALIRWGSSYGMQWSANLGMRYYVNKKRGPLEGLYLSPQLTFSHWHINSKNGGFEGNRFSVGASLLVGKQIISRNGLTLDMFTGIGVKYEKGQLSNSAFSSSYAKPKLVIPIGVNIGFGW